MLAKLKGMTLDHDFGYSFPLFSSLLKRGGRIKGEWISKNPDRKACLSAWSKMFSFLYHFWYFPNSGILLSEAMLINLTPFYSIKCLGGFVSDPSGKMGWIRNPGLHLPKIKSDLNLWFTKCFHQMDFTINILIQ